MLDLTTNIDRRVYGTDGTAYNVTFSAAGVVLREPGKQGFLLPWGVAYMKAAQVQADRDRLESGKKPKITRGLMTTR